MSFEAPPVRPGEAADAPRRPRRLEVSMVWWAMLANAGVLLVATVLLILTPITITAPVATITEIAVLLGGLMAMLLVNLVLLRRLLLPLRRLTTLMGDVDPLQPGRRLEETLGGHHAEVAVLADAFNAMLDRLELERQQSTRRVLAAQEDERARVARDLHDGLGQRLTAAAIHAEHAADDTPERRAAALRETADAIRESLDAVRRISLELRPEALDDLGLANALMALCRRVTAQSDVHVRAQLSERLPPVSREVELVVYRVVQESITNAIRHGRAQSIDVRLSATPDRLTLIVRDDGRGLPPSLPSIGTGIAGMRERAMLVGGRVTIDSPAAGGTEVYLEVPPQAVR